MANVGRFFERSHEREITAVRFHFFPSTLVPALVLLLDSVFFSALCFPLEIAPTILAEHSSIHAKVQPRLFYRSACRDLWSECGGVPCLGLHTLGFVSSLSWLGYLHSLFFSISCLTSNMEVVIEWEWSMPYCLQCICNRHARRESTAKLKLKCVHAVPYYQQRPSLPAPSLPLL